MSEDGPIKKEYILTGTIQKFPQHSGGRIYHQEVFDKALESLVDKIAHSDDTDYIKRNVEFYKDRNPWMYQKWLHRLIKSLETDIKNKYCE